VIAVSASAMKHEVKKGKQAGFNDYLTKPIDVELFFKLLDEYLG
jgi:CheY-like chemotaxis protein